MFSAAGRFSLRHPLALRLATFAVRLRVPAFAAIEALPVLEEYCPDRISVRVFLFIPNLETIFEAVTTFAESAWPQTSLFLLR